MGKHLASNSRSRCSRRFQLASSVAHMLDLIAVPIFPFPSDARRGQPSETGRGTRCQWLGNPTLRRASHVIVAPAGKRARMASVASARAGQQGAALGRQVWEALLA